MVLNDVRERFFYMSGAFEHVTMHPEKYSKEDLIRYFKVLGRLFDSPCDSLDSESIWRP